MHIPVVYCRVLALRLTYSSLGAVGADAMVFLHDLGLSRGNDSSSPYPYRKTKMAILEAVHYFTTITIFSTTSVAACRWPTAVEV